MRFLVKYAPVLKKGIQANPDNEKSTEMKKQTKAAQKAAVKPAKKTDVKKRPGRKPALKSPLKSVTFTVHAEADQNVRLAGSFTDWETKAKKMTFKKRKGVYSATVKLAPGEYQYKFIIGDKWATDDQNTEFVPNDKGTFNSKITVK